MIATPSKLPELVEHLRGGHTLDVDVVKRALRDGSPADPVHLEYLCTHGADVLAEAVVELALGEWTPARSTAAEDLAHLRRQLAPEGPHGAALAALGLTTGDIDDGVRLHISRGDRRRWAEVSCGPMPPPHEGQHWARRWWGIVEGRHPIDSEPARCAAELVRWARGEDDPTPTAEDLRDRILGGHGPVRPDVARWLADTAPGVYAEAVVSHALRHVPTDHVAAALGGDVHHRASLIWCGCIIHPWDDRPDMVIEAVRDDGETRVGWLRFEAGRARRGWWAEVEGVEELGEGEDGAAKLIGRLVQWGRGDDSSPWPVE